MSTLSATGAWPIVSRSLERSLAAAKQWRDATAQALHYNADATKVDKAVAPTWKAGEACNNCNFFQGGANDQWGPCQLFPGKAVHRAGWCAGYAKKA